MANIHAINAQGTEYGITAENGITQEQADAIATIGDVADLETTEKTTLVEAVNEVNGKLPSETVVYENATPTSAQSTEYPSLSGVTNAKALKITFGKYTQDSIALEERTFPLVEGKDQLFYLSQVEFVKREDVQKTHARQVLIDALRSALLINNGVLYAYTKSTGAVSISNDPESAKVIKIVALF